MMGACAFLMPAGSMQFVRKESYDLQDRDRRSRVGGPRRRADAAFIVKSLPL